MILDTFDRMMERYGITHIALKVPEQLSRHPSVSELYLPINIYAQNKGIPTEAYTIEQLKDAA